MAKVLNRFAVNDLTGDCEMRDFEEFMGLNRADPRIGRLNAQVYTMYKVDPTMAGYKGLKTSVLDSTVTTLVKNERMAIEYFGNMAKWEQDRDDNDDESGSNNYSLIVRNMVRFMRVWDEERVHGVFWVYKLVPAGTLLVHIQKDEEKDDDKKLGKVYLVKGMGSKVGEQLQHCLPTMLGTTLLPVYDFLVYDGIMTSTGRTVTSRKAKQIASHVEKALMDQTVISSGESSRQGLWKDPPPPLPSVAPQGEANTPINWDEVQSREDCEAKKDEQFEGTSNQKKMANAIAKYVKRVGFKSFDWSNSPTNDNGESRKTMFVRRFAYSKSENPNQMVGIRFKGGIFSYFQFDKWPTYSMDELLPQLLKEMENAKTIPHLIYVDELLLVDPLKTLLKDSFESFGLEEQIEVIWYPPASSEEETYHQTIGQNEF